MSIKMLAILLVFGIVYLYQREQMDRWLEQCRRDDARYDRERQMQVGRNATMAWWLREVNRS